MTRPGQHPDMSFTLDDAGAPLPNGETTFVLSSEGVFAPMQGILRVEDGRVVGMMFGTPGGFAVQLHASQLLALAEVCRKAMEHQDKFTTRPSIDGHA